MDQYDLYLFDLDGTLINTELLHYSAYYDMLQKYNINIPNDKFTFREYCRHAHLDGTSMKNFISQYTDLPYDTLYATKKEILLKLLDKDLQFINGAEKLLNELYEKKINTCIVTHSDDDMLNIVLKKLPLLREKVNKIITRNQYITRKPNPECYLKALNYFNPKNPIGFEDSLKGYMALKQTNITNVFIGSDTYYYYNKINPLNTFLDFTYIDWNHTNMKIEQTNNVNFIDLCLNKYISSLKSCNQNMTQIIKYLLPLITNCSRNIYLTGIGKCGHISKKCVSTWQSVGISCHYLNIPDLFHGDFGILKENDIIIYISNSGKTDELINCAQYIHNNFKVIQVALTIKDSIKLNSIVDFHFTITNDIVNEIDSINMAPSVSSVLFMAVLDMIGIKLAEENGLTIEKFKLQHPGGDLGKITNNVVDYVVINASGLGTRLFPITKFIPKILINYKNKPFIQHLIEYWQKYSQKIIIIINSKYHDIVKYYTKQYVNITLLVDDTNTGTADGINKTVGKEYYGKNIIISWCDIIPTNIIKNLYKTCVMTYGNECRYGICDDGSIQKKNNGNIIGLFYIKNYNGLSQYNIGDDICDVFSKNYPDFTSQNIANIIDIGDMDKYKKTNIIEQFNTRFFNKITIINNDKILKSSLNKQGDNLLQNEINWYKYIGKCDYVPKTFSYNDTSFEMELLNAHPLYKYFNNLNLNQKLNIINNILDILSKIHSKFKTNIILDDVKIECHDKVFNRLSNIKPFLEFHSFNNITHVNGLRIFSLDSVVNKCYEIIKKNITESTFIHGDCQFSNILYSETNKKLYFIDPRGYFGNTKFFGIPEYDYAKVLYALSGYDNMNNDPFFHFDIKNNNMILNITNHENIFDKLPSILYNETTIALVCIMWLSLAQYNSNNILKCIGSYYYGLYLYSKYIIKA